VADPPHAVPVVRPEAVAAGPVSSCLPRLAGFVITPIEHRGTAMLGDVAFDAGSTGRGVPHKPGLTGRLVHISTCRLALGAVRQEQGQVAGPVPIPDIKVAGAGLQEGQRAWV
jgi:hypothetical protein